VTLSGQGQHTLTATDTDAVGNKGTSNTVVFTLDTVAPTVAESLANDTGSSSSDNVTKDASLAGSGDPNATVTLKEGSTLLGTTTANGSGIWTFTPTGLADGSHTIVAIESDAAGNTGAASLTFTLDTTAPTAVATVTGLSADSGSSNTDFYTNVASQTVSGTYTETLGANETIQVSSDGSTWINATASAGTWSASGVTLSAGPGTLQVRTIDLAGNMTSGTGHSYTLDISSLIEAFGSTSLGEVGSNYFLYPNGGSAAELSYGGAPVVDGQFDQFAFGGHFVPIGAEQTASGYEVAWKITGADQYTVWYTDNNGNYLSSAFDYASGTSAALQSFEPSFQQDLNGDGLIGPAAVLPPSFVYQGVDANGVQLYSVTWDTLGNHPFAVRVLAPDHPSTDYAHSLLYVLPVEGGLAQSTWGSGLDALRQLDVENQYNVTIIEPIFPIDPWYADNPFDATIDFETFMATLLPAWVNSNFATSGTEHNLLIGFSKSAYGALDLLLKHPDVFDAASAWDFPADMTAYSDYGANGNYGTDSNFQNNYRLTGTFIDTWKAPFTTEDRILISEGSVFATQVADFDALLTSHGVEHTLLTQTSDAHSWSGGWLSDAVSGLYGLEQQLLVQAMASFGSSGAPVNSSGALLGADPSQQSALAAPIDLTRSAG
jgi:hypothetical protein